MPYVYILETVSYYLSRCSIIHATVLNECKYYVVFKISDTTFVSVGLSRGAVRAFKLVEDYCFWDFSIFLIFFVSLYIVSAFFFFFALLESVHINFVF